MRMVLARHVAHPRFDPHYPIECPTHREGEFLSTDPGVGPEPSLGKTH